MKNIKSLKIEIDKKLNIFFEKKIKEARAISELDFDLINGLRDFTMRGGKRIRAILMILAYQSISGKIDDSIIKASISMELIQSSLLIHDDIMDQDSIRRGGKTYHKLFAKYKNINDSNFGQSMAIIVGNIASSYAHEIIFDLDMDEEVKYKALKTINKYLIDVNFGQSMDIELSWKEKFEESDVNNVQLHKTASYTAYMPMISGAILAKATEKQLQVFADIAKNMGIAFQIMDDTIGIFGDETEIGKSVYSDIQENKKTLLVAQAYKKSNSSDKNFLINMMGSTDITLDDFDKIKKIMIKTGALQYSLDMAKKRIRKAIDSINNSDFSKDAKYDLINIANYIINKEKIKI